MKGPWGVHPIPRMAVCVCMRVKDSRMFVRRHLRLEKVKMPSYTGLKLV